MPPAQAQTKPRPKTGSRKTRERASSPRLRLPTGRPQAWVHSRLSVQLSVNRPAMPRAQPQAAPRGPDRSASRVVAGVGRAKASSPRPAALTASTHRASKIRNMGTLRHSDRQSTRCGPAVGRTASVRTFLAAWSERSFPGDLQRPCRTDRRTPCPSRVVVARPYRPVRIPPAPPSPGGASIYEFDRSRDGGALSAQGRCCARRHPLLRARAFRPGPCGSVRRNRRWSFSGLLPAGPWAPSPGPRGPG